MQETQSVTPHGEQFNPDECVQKAGDVVEETSTSTQEARGEQTASSAPDQDAEVPPVAGSDGWYQADSEAFATVHPEVDRQTLFADPDFLDYAEGKVGNVPLATIYDGYRRLVDRLSTAHSRTLAARERAPGSLRQVAAPAESEFYTLAEMQGMSSSFIEQHWDKVQKSLAHLSK